MSARNLKIAIVGDYNFTYNSHHATNLSIDHASNFLEIEISYYWVKLSEFASFKTQNYSQFDGFWIAPGPIKNPFLLNGIVRDLANRKLPTLITGEGYQFLMNSLINQYRLNLNGEKLISDNLVDGNQFEQVSIVPHSKEFQTLYQNHSKLELTASRYSLYPSLINELTGEILDIEAYNQFEEPEIVSLKNHNFFVSCGFCPQISSTREMPHPIIYTFMKSCLGSKD